MLGLPRTSDSAAEPARFRSSACLPGRRPLRGKATRVTPHVLVVDDDTLYAESLVAVLEHDGRLDVVGQAADGREAVELALALLPNVVLMDIYMPVMDGLEATRCLLRSLPDTRVVLVTSSDLPDDRKGAARVGAFAGSSEREVVDAMLEAGADAYCVKGAPLWELERAIAGASDPLLRLAHSLTRSPSGGLGALVARELHDLTGGAAAAVYL